MNNNCDKDKSLIQRFSFKFTRGVNSQIDLEKKTDGWPRLWVKNGASNKIEECANREYGMHDVQRLLFDRFVRGVHKSKKFPKEVLSSIYEMECQLKNNSRLSNEKKAEYLRQSFVLRFERIIEHRHCFGNEIILNPIKYEPDSKDKLWAKIKVLSPVDKKCLRLLSCDDVRSFNPIKGQTLEESLLPVLYLLKREHKLPWNLEWDKQKLLSLDKNIECIFEDSVSFLENALNSIKFFKNALENVNFKPKISFKIDKDKGSNYFDISNKKGKFFEIEIVGSKEALKKYQLKREEIIKIYNETCSHLINDIFLPIVEYFEIIIENIKDNKLRPCKLNAYVAFVGWLVMYGWLSSPKMQNSAKDSFYEKEFLVVMNLCKSEIGKIVKALYSYAVDVKKFLGSEEFWLVDEFHLKNIFKANDEIDEETKEFREFIDQRFQEASDEMKKIEEENKKNKRPEKKKKKNKKNRSNVSNFKNDQSLKTNNKKDNKICGNNTGLFNDKEDARVFDPKKQEEENNLKKEEEKKRKEEIQKRLEGRKKEKEEKENLKMAKHKEKIKLSNNNNNNDIKIESNSKIFEMPKRQEITEIIVKNLNANNLERFKCIFNVEGYSSNLTLTHLNVLKLGKEIKSLLEWSGYADCGKALLQDLKNHVHPNHGGGEGFYLPKNYVDILRSFFIVNGIMPERWKADSVIDLKAFHLYSLRVQSFRNKK